ncbi:MAG: hypothetical protein HQL94_06915 [Magnetococcales bacterium]|nr:hypothetical protein [Magnetococcales bacterium]
MNIKQSISHREAGGFLTKVMMIFVILGLGMTAITQVGGEVYQYFLLRDLADRVAKEYGKLPVEEVKRRIDFETNRSKLPTDALSLTKTTKGYRVVVEHTIPLALTFGDTVLAVPGHEEWVMTYKVES